MAVFKNIFFLIIACLFVPSIFAETETRNVIINEITNDLEEYRTGFSLGVDDFPWNACRVSLQWWNKDGIGKELSIDKFYLSINKVESTESEYGRRTTISFPGVTYYFLYRDSSSSLNGLYVIRGFGFGLGFETYFSEITHFNIDHSIDKRYTSSLSVYIPIGIEHFFWDRFPNLSYSVGFDLYGSFSYSYRFRDSNDNQQRGREGTLNLGISSPKFFIRWCF